MVTLTLGDLGRDDLIFQIVKLKHRCHPNWLAPNPEPDDPSDRSLRRWIDRLEAELARREETPARREGEEDDP